MRPRNANGQLTIQYPESRFIDTVKELGKTNAAEVAEEIGCSKVVATRRLRSLVNEGLIQSNKISGRWVFWC